MNELQIFKNKEFGAVRTAVENEVIWFCLMDICRALKLTPKEVNRRLDDEVVSKHPIEDSLGRTKVTGKGQQYFINRFLSDGLQ